MNDEKKLNKDIVKLFIESNNSKDYENLIKNYQLYYQSLDSPDAPYPEITEYVLSNKDNINIDSIIDIYTNQPVFRPLNKDFQWQEFLRSFEKHYKLAEIQKKHIESMFNEMKSDVEEAESKVNEIKDIKSTIYTEFIAILGIFSALLFGMFVGFDTFKELIAGITSNVKISRVVILGSLMLLGLNFLVFLLLDGISHLSGRNIKNCCNKANCNCNITRKYPMFFYSTIILIMVILISSAVLIFNNDGIVYSTGYHIYFIVIIILLACISISTLYMAFYYIKKKK